MNKDTSVDTGPDHLRNPRIAKVVLAAAFSGASALTLSLKYAAHRFTAPDVRETRFLTPWELGIPYEDVTFETDDGVGISGWWLPNPEAKRTVVALAGYNSARHHMLGIGSGLWRRGANILLFDNRGRGTSEGEKISLGYHERLDASSAVDYALSRCPELPLGMVGFSMGGSVAIMVAATDERVRLVVADSPFASQKDLVSGHLRRYAGPFTPPAFAVAKSFLHYDIAEVEPVEDIGKLSPRPVLLVHGNRDSVTPPEHSRRLYEAAGEPKELWMVEGAGHIDSYFTNREEYTQKVGDFIENHLG